MLMCCHVTADEGHAYLKVDGLTPELLDIVIDYAYGGVTQSITYDDCLALLAFSHKFHIPKLHQECERVLSSLVSSTTLPLLTHVSAIFECQKLEQVQPYT